MDKYEIIGKQTVFKSEKVQVDRETVALPNGNKTEWYVMVYPDFYEGVTIRDGKVLMTREWRLGPHDYLTQFTKTRAPHKTEKENLAELARELKEELGVVGGDYEKVLRFAQGERLTGFCTVYLVTNFEVGRTSRDENEIQQIIELPIKNLYQELAVNHVVMPETLLIAKLLEEKFGS
jgi:hypothetical protein